jgi:hypothetical protein
MAPRLLLVGLALLLFGCGGGGDSKPAPQRDRTQELLDGLDTRPRKIEGPQDKVRGLLADRARALQSGDAAALARTSTGAQRARDRRSASRTSALALARVHYAADELQTTGRTATAVAVLSYRLRGIERPFRVARRIKARRTGDGWRISRDAPRHDSAPWEAGAYVGTRSRHVVLLTPKGFDPAQLRPGLEQAYRDIRRDLPKRDLPPSVLVIAARNAGEAERLTGDLGRHIVALANVSVRWGPGPAYPVRRVLSQRMIVVLSRWETLPADERRITLVHEMTHTALNPDTSGRTPAWLIEGAAMYVSGEDRSAEASARAADGTRVTLASLSKPFSISRMNASDRGAAAYAVSSAAAHAIVARRGTKGLFALYDRFNDNRIFGRPSPRLVNRILRRTVDMSLAELEAAAAGG